MRELRLGANIVFDSAFKEEMLIMAMVLAPSHDERVKINKYLYNELGSTKCEIGYCMGVGGKTTGWLVGEGTGSDGYGAISLEGGTSASPP